MSDLKTRIDNDMKQALREKMTGRLGTIRLLLAAIKQREIDERTKLDDAGIVAIIDKMIKQRLESIEQYTAAKREELADKERAEIKVLEEYLPTRLSEAEITGEIQAALKVCQAHEMKDMGKVMAYLKPKLQGRADMSKVSQLIKSHLSS